MEEKDYDLFFEQMSKFIDKQNEQKAQGLNDYSSLGAVRWEHEEVGMHSNVIYSLLNPNGLHYRGELFLQLFVKHVLKIDDIGEIESVKREEVIGGNRRIDFTIKSTNYYIGIEMKINAGDLKDQLSDYYKHLEKDKNTNAMLYYLTADGKQAWSQSSNGVEYKAISFKDEILLWLKKCKKAVRNITNLNVFFKDYINVVKKITNQYKGNVMTLEEYIKENMGNSNKVELYKIMKEITNILTNTDYKKNIVKDFFAKVKDDLNAKLNSDEKDGEWHIKLNDKSCENYGTPIEIYKSDWNKNNKYLRYIIEFQNKNYHDAWFGIVSTDKSIDIDKFRSYLPKEVIGSKHPQWLSQIKILDNDFIEYLLDENNFNKFVEIILNHINATKEYLSGVNQEIQSQQ